MDIERWGRMVLLISLVVLSWVFTAAIVVGMITRVTDGG